MVEQCYTKYRVEDQYLLLGNGRFSHEGNWLDQYVSYPIRRRCRHLLFRLSFFNIPALPHERNLENPVTLKTLNGPPSLKTSLVILTYFVFSRTWVFFFVQFGGTVLLHLTFPQLLCDYEWQRLRPATQSPVLTYGTARGAGGGG